MAGIEGKVGICPSLESGHRVQWSQSLEKAWDCNATYQVCFKKRLCIFIFPRFGISFTARFLNQAGALVHVYTDGSVLLSHGGTEMGQGLHTKMVQVCAEALGIPMDLVHISETATDKVANASPTAASASSDLNGMAILDACRQINERLKPFKDANPTLSFREVETVE